MTSISIVIPVFRGWTHLHELLDAIRLEDDNDIEVIVVDDASNDGGVIEVRTRHPLARIVVREVNGGFAAAVNSGVAVASGRVVVIANSDLLTDLATVRVLANSADGSPMTVFAPRVLTRAGNEQIIGHRWPTPWNSARDLFHADFFRRCVGVRPLNASDDEYCPDWVVAACLAVSMDCLLSVGPFDESYFMYGEEVDWQRRASLLGGSARILRECVVTHDESHGASEYSEAATLRFMWIWRNRVRYLRKFGYGLPALRIRILIFGAVIVNCPVYIVMLLSKRHRRQAVVRVYRLRRLLELAVVGSERFTVPRMQASVRRDSDPA